MHHVAYATLSNVRPVPRLTPTHIPAAFSSAGGKLSCSIAAALVAPLASAGGGDAGAAAGGGGGEEIGGDGAAADASGAWN